MEGEQVQEPEPEPEPEPELEQVREQASGVGGIWVRVALEEKALGGRVANNEEASCLGWVPRNSWVDLDRNQTDRRPSIRGDIQGKGSDPSRAALAVALAAALDCAVEAAVEAHAVDEGGVDREENPVGIAVGTHRVEGHRRGWVGPGVEFS